MAGEGVVTMIHRVYFAECDYCHAKFSAGGDNFRLITCTEGMRTALRSEGWFCGAGRAPQVLCPNCKHLKEEET